MWRLSELSTDKKDDEDSKSKKSSKKTKKEKKTAKSDSNSENGEKSESSGGFFDSPEVDGYDKAVLFAGVDLSVNGKDLAFHLGMDVFGSDFVGFSMMFHHETLDCLGEDKGFNVLGFGIAVRVPIKMGEFGLNPYLHLNGNMGFGDKRVVVGYTAETGIQAMFNTEGDVHFGLGAGFKQIFLTQFMDLDMSFDTDREKIDSFTNRGISIYGILSF